MNKEQEKCRCDIESGLYNDMTVIKCQYCGKKVSDERAKEFIKFNTPNK